VQVFADWHTWEHAEPGLRAALPSGTVARLRQAVSYAQAHHGDQRRPTGTPYLEHLLEALEVLVRGAGVTDPGILCAAVLHDVVEDTDRSVDDVRAAFGARVADLVGWVTIPEPGPGQDRAGVKEEYLRGLRRAPRDAMLVKLADRVSNAQTLQNLPAARQRAYYAQTVEYIVPLAAGEPWFADWYASWESAFAALGAQGPGGSPPAPPKPSQEIPSQASRPIG
jgi:(p)ppGpp synthase/HD superfamily hydrolase